MNKTSILVVEDDKAVRNLIATTLETQGYDYLTAETGASALMQAVSGHPDIMILDLGLPDMDGVEIIKKVRGWSSLPIIVVRRAQRGPRQDQRPRRRGGRQPDQAVFRRRAARPRAGGAAAHPVRQRAAGGGEQRI